ncbi:MAG: response regulator [Planctomycetaceae bacterium]
MSHILVVDDSSVDRRLASGLLEKDSRWKISQAANGREALAAMSSCIPDVVITDLVMPEIDGLELVAAAKNDYPLVPIVLMTGKGSEEIALKALRAGAVGYVPKKRLNRELVSTSQKILTASIEDRSLVRLMHRMTANEASFELHNDPALIFALVTYLQQMIRALPLADETDRLRVRLAVEEALSNALYHGNLGFQSELSDLDPGARQAEVLARASEAPYRDRRISVTTSISRARAIFTIRDEGTGFDPSSLMGATPSVDLDQTFGRGLLLMQTFMDEVRYNATGNEVTLVKRSSVVGDEADEVEDES